MYEHSGIDRRATRVVRDSLRQLRLRPVEGGVLSTQRHRQNGLHWAMRPKILMLDVDGVLVHPDGESWKDELESVIGVAAAHMSAHYFKKYWQDVIVGRADMKRTLRRYLTDHKLNCGVDALVRYWFESDGIRDEEILSTLAEHRASFEAVFLATNQEKHRANYLWEELDLKRSTDGIFYSGELGVSKPDRDFFATVTRAIGTSPSDIFFLDDAEKNVQGAIDFGWQATLYQRGRTDLDAVLRSL